MHENEQNDVLEANQQGLSDIDRLVCSSNHHTQNANKMPFQDTNKRLLNINSNEIVDKPSRPFLNMDVLYRFTPKTGMRNIKCYATKSLSSKVVCCISERAHILVNEKKIIGPILFVAWQKDGLNLMTHILDLMVL